MNTLAKVVDSTRMTSGARPPRGPMLRARCRGSERLRPRIGGVAGTYEIWYAYVEHKTCVAHSIENKVREALEMPSIEMPPGPASVAEDRWSLLTVGSCRRRSHRGETIVAHQWHRSNDLPPNKLGAIQVQHVVDPRTIPRSRHNPQFSRDQLSPALHRRKIHFRHMPWLGGAPQTARMADGAMPAFAAMSTTCRRRSSMTAWRVD